MTEDDSEALSVVRVRDDDLTAEQALLTAGPKQAKEELDILAARIGEFSGAAATCHGALGIVVQAVRSLKLVLQQTRIGEIQRKFRFARLWTRCQTFGYFPEG